MSDEVFAGRVIITWPKYSGVTALPGWGVTVADADSGKPITGALMLTLNANPHGVITAEMTMLIDADGKPLVGSRSKPVLAEDGEHPLTGVFHWLVAEMRIAE